MSPRRLVLWDIDGTLLSTGPTGRLALERGASHASGLDMSTIPEVAMGGKTDPQIVAEILTACGLAQDAVERLLPAALREAERALADDAGTMASEGSVHPGVAALLDRLAATDGVRQTLLTGNIAPNARLKLRTFGMERYFDFDIGAYGDDHPNRDCLVPIALERAQRLRGARYAPEEVWVIGDTVHDLRCANAGGVRCLIVGTGQAGTDAVRTLDADAVFDDLSDTDLVVKMLVGR